MLKPDKVNAVSLVEKKKLRSNYDPVVQAGRPRTVCGEGRTKQAMRSECDINWIVARFQKTGLLPGSTAPGQYGDFSDVPSYQESYNRVMAAQEQFAKMPAKVRARFANDPAQFLEFASDVKNADALVELGLAVKVKRPEPEVTKPKESVVDTK